MPARSMRAGVNERLGRGSDQIRSDRARAQFQSSAKMLSVEGCSIWRPALHWQ